MAHNPQRVLVTGGGGFVGKAVIKRLIRRGDIVTSFSRCFYPELREIDVRQIQGDLTDADAVCEAIKGNDVVFHVGAKAGIWGDFDTYYQINTRGTIHVIDACRAHDVQSLIFTSSSSVVFDGENMEGADEKISYPDHYETAYPETKALAEQAVRSAAERGLKTICLRPHLVWGPGDNHLAPRILKRAGRLRRVGDGRNLVDTTYIDNVAQAHILAADALIKNPILSGNVYFISQDEPVRLWEMINQILAAGGKPPVHKQVSFASAYRIGAVMEWLYRYLRLPGEPPMTRFMARTLSTHHWFDITAAKMDLGYQPTVTIAEGLRRLNRYLTGGESSA